MPIRLHVVYAGRGDAMIVEDGQRLYMLDGGPQGYVAGGQRSGAPYYRYYMSALRAVATAVGQPADRVLPDAVIVSHAHEDHFGGIEAVFDRFLAPNRAVQPTPAAPLVFNGPLVTQVLDDEADMDEDELGAVLQRFHFTAQDAGNEPVFNAFTFADGNGVSYSVYGRPQAQPLGRAWTVDTSPDNLASVLMFHDATKMVFTGDSAGYLVAPFVQQCVHGLNDPSISIFKVPHHGSLRNSQRAQVLGSVPVPVLARYAMLCIKSPVGDWDAIQMPQVLRDPGAVAAAAVSLDWICGLNNVDPAALLAALQAAFTQTMANLQNAAADPFAPFLQLPPNLKPVVVWNQLYAHLDGQSLGGNIGVTASGGRPTKRSRAATMAPLSRSWYTRLNQVRLADPFLGTMAAAQLRAFFASFVAKNYVISADSTYAHPSAETLAAIAAVAVQRQQLVRVLVTDGSAVNLNAINQLAPQNWRTYVDLRYLSKGARMVLDVSQPQNADNIALLDPDGTTSTLLFTFGLPALHQQFQNNRGATIAGRTLVDDRFQLKVSGQNLYLNLANDATISVTGTLQSFNLDESWTLSLTNPGALPNPSTFDDVRLRLYGSNVNPGPARLLRLVAPPNGGAGHVLMVPPDLFGVPQYVTTNAVGNYLSPNIAAAAVFTFAKVTTATARRPLGLVSADPRRALATDTPAVSLRAFCQAVGVPTDQPLTAAQALPQLVGPEAATALGRGIALDVLQRVLGWNADLDASTVDYTVDEYGPLVSAASVSIQLGTPLTFTIDGEQETIASAAATLTRANGDELALAASVTSTTGVQVSERAQATAPVRFRTLDQYLSALGVEPSMWPNVTVGTLLTAIVGAQPNAEQMLLRTPSFIASAGIAEWLLDHGTSEVETQVTVSGDVEVVSARLVTQTPGGIQTTVEGLSVAISEVVLAVSDARLPTMELVLEASASAGSVTLGARSTLTDEGSELVLTLPAEKSLQDLVSLLPGSPDLGSLSVPLASQALSGLSFSSPGIVISQPTLGAEPYVLDEVFGTVSFSGWASVLPSGWPTPSSSSLSVRVLSPLDADERQVALAVSFDFTTSTGKTLTAELAAEPVPDASPATWSYRLSAYSDPATEPCTVDDVLGAVGLSGPLQSLTATLPALGQVTSRLALGELTCELVVPDSGPATVDALYIGLAMLGGWEIVPGTLTLGAVQVDLSYEAEAWSGSASADAALGGAYSVSAGLELPTAESAGAISFTSSNPNLTITELVRICGLGDLSSVPVIGTLLSLAVTDAELVLVYPGGQGNLALASAAFTVCAGDEALGVLDLSALSFSIERRLLGEGGQSDPSTSFWLEAEWDETKIASIAYDGVKAELAAALRMTGDETIADLLGKLLGSSLANALLPVIGQFKVRDGSLVLSSADYSLKSFAIDLDTSAALQIGTATVSELSVSYAAAGQQPALYQLEGTMTGSGTEATIAIDCVAGDGGTVSATIASAPGTSGLTARGLLGLLGLSVPQVLTPDGAPQLFDVKVTQVSAEFALEPEFQLETLSVSVVTTATLPLLDTPKIDLTGIALEVDYDRSGTPTTTSGFVTGQVQIEQALVTVKYVQGSDGQPEFQASVEPAGEDTPDFATLIASGAYDPGYGLPTGLGIPSQIPMARLTVVARPQKFVDVAGYKVGTSWPASIGSLSMEVGSLGGRIRVEAPAQQGGSVTYEASLFGQLVFNGFLSTTATFSFGSGSDSVLTATATGDPSAIQLPQVAGALGSPWTDVLPSGTAPLSFGSAAFVYVDFTSGDFALYGSLKDLGSAALLSVVRSNNARSYLFAAGLAQPFSFGSLWSALAPVDQYLHVTAANAALLAYDGTLADLQADLTKVSGYAQRQGVSFSAPFADLPALGTELEPTTQLPEGFSFFASIDLTGGTLSGALGKIADSSVTEPSLVLWALIDHTTPANTTYSAELSGLELLGGHLTLDGTASYQPSAAETLAVAADVGVKLTSEGEPYVFHSELTVAATQTTFSLTGQTGPTQIAQPFGMFGVTIASPRLTVSYSYPESQPTTSTVEISGSVSLTIGGSARQLDGFVYFVNGVPVVAAVKLTLNMSVLDLFADIVTGGTWPSGYSPITLIGGSIYYAELDSGSIEIDDVEYLSGYHVTTDVDFFGAQFHVDVAVETNGVLVSGSYVGSIDLVIVQLTGYTDPHTNQATPGPTVAIDTRNPSGTIYELECGISVFGTPFLTTKFSYQPALSKYAGTATYQGEIVGVSNPSVSFTYSDAEGLRITDWPLSPVLGQVLDYAKMLEEASQGSSCGQLVGLVFDKAIETDFSLSLSQNGAISGNTLPLKLGGTYTLKVAGNEVFSLPLPDLDCSISAPSGFELDNLAEWVGQTIVDNAVSIGKSLLNDMVGDQRALKVFIAQFALQQVSQETLTALLCDGADAENVQDATNESIDETSEGLDGPEGPLEGVLTPAETALTSTSLADAAAAFAAAVTAMGALVAAVKALVDLIEEAWDWLTGGRRDDKQKAEDTQSQGQTAVDNARNRIDGLLTMNGQPAAAFVTDSSVQVSWSDDNMPHQQGIDYGGYAGFSFNVQVAADAQFANVLGSGNTSQRSLTVSAAALGGLNTAYVRVQALYDQFSGAWISGSAFHKIPLAAPASVTEARDAAQDIVGVTVDSVTGASSYTVDLVDSAHGNALVATQSVAAPSPSPASVQGTFAAGGLPAGAQAGAVLLARAMAVGDPSTREDSPYTYAPVGGAVPTAGPPTGVSVALTPGGIHASWAAVPNATGYAVRVVDAQGAPLSPQPTIALDGLACDISGSGIVDGVTLGVEARPTGQPAVGLWSSAAQVAVHVLAAPSGLAALYLQPENELSVSWSELATATAYEVAVTDGAGNALSPAPTISIDGCGATVSGPAIAVGGSYRVLVRGTASGYVSTWSAPVDVQASVVATPGSPQLTYQSAALNASWSPVGDASSYRLELSSGAQPVAEVEPQVPPVALGPATHVPLVPGVTYALSVRALVGTSVGPAATASASVPTLLALVMADHHASAPASQAAADSVALLPGVGPAQLFDTLLAAAYPPNLIRAAVQSALPATTSQQLDAIVHALTDTLAMARLLVAESVPGPVIVALCRTIFSPLPVVLAVVLKQAAVADTGLADAFAAAFDLPPTQAAQLVSAVYDDSTGDALAQQLHAAGVDRPTATADVAACWSALTPQQVAAAITAAYGPAST